MCLCLKYLVRPSKRRVELGVWEVVFFPVAEEIVSSFFNFLFDIFWNSVNLAYASQPGEEDLVYDYLFTTQREFHSDPDFFCYTFTDFAPFGIIENRVIKINFKYFNGNCDYSSCLG